MVAFVWTCYVLTVSSASVRSYTYECICYVCIRRKRKKKWIALCVCVCVCIQCYCVVFIFITVQENSRVWQTYQTYYSKPSLGLPIARNLQCSQRCLSTACYFLSPWPWRTNDPINQRSPRDLRRRERRCYPRSVLSPVPPTYCGCF